MPHPAMCISRRQVQRPILTKFLCLHVSRKGRTNVHQPHFGIAGSLLPAAAIRNFLLLAPLWLPGAQLERPSSRPPPVPSPASLSEVKLVTMEHPRRA